MTWALLFLPHIKQVLGLISFDRKSRLSPFTLFRLCDFHATKFSDQQTFSSPYGQVRRTSVAPTRFLLLRSRGQQQVNVHPWRKKKKKHLFRVSPHAASPAKAPHWRLRRELTLSRARQQEMWHVAKRPSSQQVNTKHLSVSSSKTSKKNQF